MEELKLKHDQELQKYVLEHNSKYKALMTQKLDLEDKLDEKDKIIEELKKEIEEMKKRFNDKMSKDQ